MRIILSINAGSSSVKVSVYQVADGERNPHLIADAQVSGLTAPPSKITYKRGEQTVHKNKQVDVKGQSGAFELLLDTLIKDDQLEGLSKKEDISLICHRIVHGGDYGDAQIITRDTYHRLEHLSDLAPLHNGPALGIVEACTTQLPGARNIACFDSQFHASIPAHISTYPIDQEIARKNHLRKYGFHGISYAFITRSVADFLQKDASELNIIALHLGSGASACAIKNGRSWDTSMGLTPLAGLPGATRSGSVDPSLVFHYASDVGKLSPASTSHLHISKAEEILNKQSGWSALTGTTDFAAITSSASTSSSSSSPTPSSVNAKLAFDLFVDRICGFIGSYFVSLKGNVDALVFAGGIGEKSAVLRTAVVEQVKCLGFDDLDRNRNEKDGGKEVVRELSRGGADGKNSRKVLVCQTDEQYEMARLCATREDLWA